MEKHINRKINEYIQNFKEDVKKLIDHDEMNINGSEKNKLKNFIDSYSRLQLENEDFKKRKRVKNQVPDFLRCHALRADGNRCSRRKQENGTFCGTHIKLQPNGMINDDNNDITKINKMLTLIQIKGIDSWIDDNGNIYNMEDMQLGKENPRIHGQYSLSENGEYIIKP